MVINIELPDETVAALIAQAQTQRRPAADLAAEAVAERYGVGADQGEFPLDPAALESLRHGFADMEAGRTLALADAHAEFTAAFLTRFGEGGA